MNERSSGIKEVQSISLNIEFAVDEWAFVDEILFETDGGEGGFWSWLNWGIIRQVFAVWRVGIEEAGTHVIMEEEVNYLLFKIWVWSNS